MSTTRREFIRSVALATSAPLLDRVIPGCPAEQPAQTPSPDILYDNDGLIVHRGCDGGDTAQREGWYWFGLWIRQYILKDFSLDFSRPNEKAYARKLSSFDQVLRLLEPASDGIFYRHPKLPPWNNPYDKDWGFSRDQMIPLVAAMGVWGKTTELRRLWNALPQDVIGGTKHTFNGQWQTLLGQKTIYTGDDVKLGTINLFRRAWNEDPMTASDGNGGPGEDELAANVGIRLVAGNDRDNTGDDLNLIVMLLMSILRSPSATSTAAVNLYAKNRPISYGSFLETYYSKYQFHPDDTEKHMADLIDKGIAGGWKTDSSRVYGAVRWYQRAESGANPKLAELYRPIVSRYLE
jgi:hypothetical protein